MIPFTHRFHGRGGMRNVYTNGKAGRSHFATLKYLTAVRPKGLRLSVVVSKKVIKSAVKRNRIRRRVYEYLRPQIDRFVSGSDIVVIISTSEFVTMSPDSLKNELDNLFSNTDLYKQS